MQKSKQCLDRLDLLLSYDFKDPHVLFSFAQQEWRFVILCLHAHQEGQFRQ
jgi:hypothetical protein